MSSVGFEPTHTFVYQSLNLAPDFDEAVNVDTAT